MVKEADAELIVQLPTTPGNLPDGVALPALAQPQTKYLTGEAYDRKTNHSHLAHIDVASVLHPRLPRPGRPRKSWRKRPMTGRKFAECKQSHACAGPATGVWPR
jgi:hypothetical protein